MKALEKASIQENIDAFINLVASAVDKGIDTYLYIVNFNLNNGVMVIYRRDEFVDAHKEEYGVNLEKIIQNKSSLESFIKDDIN
jgi:hypothetical protein